MSLEERLKNLNKLNDEIQTNWVETFKDDDSKMNAWISDQIKKINKYNEDVDDYNVKQTDGSKKCKYLRITISKSIENTEDVNYGISSSTTYFVYTASEKDPFFSEKNNVIDVDGGKRRKTNKHRKTHRRRKTNRRRR